MDAEVKRIVGERVFHMEGDALWRYIHTKMYHFDMDYWHPSVRRYCHAMIPATSEAEAWNQVLEGHPEYINICLVKIGDAEVKPPRTQPK